MSRRKATRRPIVLAAVMLAMFMAAVEATIVATAMPGIVADLGGFTHFSWVFSSYLLMQVVMIPIYGKLADLYGRKVIFTIGVGIFLVGSILCGFSWSMELLIISRFIQGAGAGAVQPIATTIVGDMYTKEERASIQGYLSSIWGVSAIIGPLLGALFTQFTHWAWVFWVNIPFGILAIILVQLFLHEKIEKKERSVDYGGTILLFAAVAPLMFVLVQLDSTAIFPTSVLISIVIVSLLAIVWFINHEKKAKDPIMTLSLWKRKEIRYANLASFTAGAMLLAVSSFLPTYVQGVLEQSPLVAGMTLTVMSIGWPISSMIAGKMMLKTCFRVTALIGGIGLLVGSLCYFTLPYINYASWAAAGSFMLGVGLGFSTTTFIVSIQSSVSWELRGEATAMNMFMRLLGGAVGVAFLGGILNSRLRAFLEREGSSLTIHPDTDMVRMILDADEKAKLSVNDFTILQSGLAESLLMVFAALFVLAVLSFIFITRLPKDGEKNKEVG